MKFKLFIIGIGAIFLGGFYALSLGINQDEPSQNTVMSFGGRELSVKVADTPESRAHGLSGLDLLPAGEGLLFVFEAPESPGFWMKDMNFPIDILWFDSEKKLVDITEDFLPESFPETVYPIEPVMYVLETNINEFENIGDLIGEGFVFN
ncbi:DUF192 domain-containing protein [Candidatus Parcubacteria bacterium]|nr:DUF192 domain-containing protein [Candidatus Parcubacteria bacterium]